MLHIHCHYFAIHQHSVYLQPLLLLALRQLQNIFCELFCVTFCLVSVIFVCKYLLYFFVTCQIFPFHKHYLSGQYGAPYPGGPKFESHSDKASTSLILKLIKVQHIHHPFIPSVSFPPCTCSYHWPNSV